MKSKLKSLNLKRIVTTLLITVFFAAAGIAFATTPNPGHPWAETGDGTFQVSGPTSLRTYVFPDANATVLTSASSTTDLPQGTNLYYTQALFDTAFGNKSTSDLPQGTNLYFTDAAARAAISGTSPINYSSATGVISIAAANTSTPGYLTSADWTTFNGKENAVTAGTSSQYYRGDKTWQTLNTDAVAQGTNLYYTDAAARAAISGSSPVGYSSATGIISMAAADTGTPGYLTSTDWTTFNGKVSGSRSISTSAPLSGGGDLSADRTLSITQASGTTDGFLSSTDWTTFNSKENGLTFSGPLSRNTNTISIPAADSGTNGYLSSTDWSTFNGKENAVTAGTSSQYYRGDKTWQTLNTDAVPQGTNLYYTDAAVDARIAVQAGQANGLATLGADSKISSSQLPAITITNTYVVVDQAAMLALTAQTGDVAVRTDLNQSFILAGTSASTLSDWQVLLTPTDTVQSVNGFTGAVTLTTSDITQGTNLYYTDAVARAAISGSSPVGYSSATGVISMAAADTGTNGYLKSTDWTTFNGKQNPLTFSGPLSLNTGVVSIPVATAIADGYLSLGDWTTFNTKLSSTLTSGHLFVGSVGNVATDVALSGDATLSNTGALTIASGAVTLSKMADIATGTLLGRNTALTGNVETLTTIPSGIQDNITRLGTVASGVWNGSSIGTGYTDAKIKTVTGTTDRITTAGTATDPTFDIAATYAGQGSITTLGTIGSGTWNGSVIDLAHGGTNANLVASNGGIFYSTGTAGAILSGTSTAGQMLQSGSNTAPAWSTATFPATTTANQLLYSGATNTVGGLTSGNNGVLVTDVTGVPSISSTIPSATQDNITRLGTVASGVWHGSTIDDTYITTPYIKADGTRGLSGDWNAGAYVITAKDFAVSGTAGAGYVNLLAQSSNAAAPSATGLNIYAGSAGNLSWAVKNGTDVYNRSFTGTLTADRNWALPDVGGTLLLADGGQTVTSATWNGTAIGAPYGGTGQTVYAVGDLLYADTTTSLAKLSVSTDGKILTLAGGVPTWAAPAAAGVWGSITGTLANQADLVNTRKGGFGITLDGQGGVVSTGSKGYIIIPYAGTITNWYIVGDQSGSVVVDIKRGGVSIVGAGNKPTLSSQASANAAVSGWTSTAITANDTIEFNVDSATTVTRVNLVVEVTKT